MSAAVKKWKIQFLFKMDVFLSSAGNIRFFFYVTSKSNCSHSNELFPDDGKLFKHPNLMSFIFI